MYRIIEQQGTSIVEFLHARLDEDEQVALAAYGAKWEVGPTFGARNNRVYVRQQGDLIDSVGTCVITGQVSNVPQFRANAQHIARWDPARVLAEVKTKRHMVEWCIEVIGDRDLSTYGQFGFLRDDPQALAVTLAFETLRLLAQIYSAHPAYDPAWAPEQAVTLPGT